MLFIFLTACFLILLDQLSKNFIVNHFTLGESKEILSNFFSITSHRIEELHGEFYKIVDCSLL